MTQQYLISTDESTESFLSWFDEKTKDYYRFTIVDIDDIYEAIEYWCKEYQYKYDKETVVWKVDTDEIYFYYTEDWDNVCSYKAIWSLIKLKWIRDFDNLKIDKK